MKLEEFLREQHKRIGILKRSLRGRVAKKLFSIQKFLEDIAIDFYNKSGVKDMAEKFIFSCSKRQMASLIGVEQVRAGKYLLLAAALGLVKRVTISEGHSYSEYFGRAGIGIQQYRLELIDTCTVNHRWNMWTQSNHKTEEINLNLILEVFGSEVFNQVNTHPEAKDKDLRDRLKQEREEFEDSLIETLEEETDCRHSLIRELANSVLDDIPTHGYRLSYLVNRRRTIFGEICTRENTVLNQS